MPAALTVLESFPSPRATSVNPYTILLARSIAEAGARVEFFSWRNALTGRFDVFHVHWPEILVDGRTPLRKLVRQALTLLLVARLAVTRRPIVRTVHNLDVPDGLSRAQRAILALIDRRTTVRIVLNRHTPVARSTPAFEAPHADFREWFSEFEAAEITPGQVGYVGRIRRYKGVETLIAAISETRDVFVGAAPSRPATVSARIVGYPSTPELAASLQREVDASPHTSIEFGFVSDATIVDVVTSSELVVLPYRVMHNSSAAITALSLDRPVLVPSNAVTADLAEEMGEGWVHVFEGELSGRDILRALDAVRSRPPTERPRMDDRSWRRSGEQHVRAFSVAIAIMEAQ